MNSIPENPEKKKENNSDEKVEIVVSWAEIKHHRHFEHIVALGSRVDMLVTANSILIAGLLLLLFGSSESETIRSQITPELQISSFIFLGFSLLFCVTSALMRVRTKKKEVKRCFIQKILRFIKNCARVIWPSKSEPEDYFSRKPNSINVYVNQINRYSKEARKSIIWRHRFLNLSAILTLFGFLCIARMIFSLIFDP